MVYHEKRKHTKSTVISNDVAFASRLSQDKSVSTTTKITKTCGLCHQRQKHSRYNCPKLVLNDKKVKGVEFGFNSDEARESLYNDINRTNGYIKCLPKRDKREILSSLPAKVKGLQIHNKFVAHDDFTTHDISIITLEYTMIFDYGLQQSDYCNVLLKPLTVAQWISKSTTNLVCSWFKWG